MNQVVENTAVEVTETAAVEVTPKAPSKKTQAFAIFQSKLEERSHGLYGSNKEFRAAVLTAIQTELGVSVASAATMYNSAKSEAEKTDPNVGLGRDPKKIKVKTGTGKRGRPAGSKNKPKQEVPAETAADVESAQPASEETV